MNLWQCPGRSYGRRGLSLAESMDILLLGGAQALSLLLWVALWLSARSKRDGFGANQALSWWQLGKIPGIQLPLLFFF